MSKKRELCYSVLSHIPYKMLIKRYPKMKQTFFSYVIEEIIKNEFVNKSDLYLDFEKYIDRAKNFNKYCIIECGNWKYRIINFLFINEMLSMVLWCLECGYKPIINVFPTGGIYSEETELWGKMFNQPFNADVNTVFQSEDYIICPIKSYIVYPNYDYINDTDTLLFWNKFYKEFFVFNDTCKQYVDSEYERIIKGKKVLGCLGRGTDYTDTKPKGHPIQPTIKELIQESESVMKKHNLHFIYLATEEKKIADAFKAHFGNEMILENKRNYFDIQYDTNDSINRVSQVSFGRENDDFKKSLEYISSINLLSKCDAIVAGRCGGSRAAVYLNGGKYIERVLFDKGLY